MGYSISEIVHKVLGEDVHLPRETTVEIRWSFWLRLKVFFKHVSLRAKEARESWYGKRKEE